MSKANKGVKRDHLVQYNEVIKQCSHIFKCNPECLFQELHNRLKHKAESDDILDEKLRAGREKHTAPWLRLRMGRYENPIISVLTGHRTGISDCCFSPTGNLLVSIDIESEILLWDWSNGELINVSRCTIPDLRECFFSPCGSRIFILAGREDGIRYPYHLVIYDSHTGKYYGPFGSCVDSLDNYGLNAQKGLIAIPNNKSDIEIIDYHSGQIVEVLPGHEGKVFSTKFDINGDRLVSAGEDGNIIIWEISKMDILDVQNWDAKNALCCTFTNDLKKMVAGYEEVKFKIWSVNSGICQVDKQFVELHEEGHDNCIMRCFYHNGLKSIICEMFYNRILVLDSNTLEIKTKKYQQSWSPFREKCVSRSGDKLIVGGLIPDHSAYVIDVKQDKQTAQLRGHTFEIENCIMNADGIIAATSSCDRSIMVWNVQKAEEIDKMRDSSHEVDIQHISPDSRLLLTSNRKNPELKLWNLSNYKLIKSLPGHNGGIEKARFSHDGSKIASIGKEDAALRLWDSISGEELSCFSYNDIGLDDSSFSGDFDFYIFPHNDRYIILTDSSTISLIEIKKNTLIKHLEKPTNIYDTELPFSPAGHLVIGKEEPEKIMLWDIYKNRISTLYEGPDISGFSDFSPDGKTFGLANLNENKLVFIDTLKNTVKTLSCSKESFKGFTFSPDGNYYAVVEKIKNQNRYSISVFLRSEEKIKLSYQFDVLLEETYRFGFSNDGNRIYWASDEQIKIYEINTGNCLALNAKIGGISGIEFSPDGKHLVFGNGYGELFIFTLENVAFGNPIVTPLAEKNILFFRCPVCNTQHDISESDLGKEYSCGNCLNQVQLNKFICKIDIF